MKVELIGSRGEVLGSVDVDNPFAGFAVPAAVAGTTSHLRVDGEDFFDLGYDLAFYLEPGQTLDFPPVTSDSPN